MTEGKSCGFIHICKPAPKDLCDGAIFFVQHWVFVLQKTKHKLSLPWDTWELQVSCMKHYFDSQQCETDVLAFTTAMICSIAEGSNGAAATAQQNSITSCLLSQLNIPNSRPSLFLLKELWIVFRRRPFQSGSAWILTSNTSNLLNKSNTRGLNFHPHHAEVTDEGLQGKNTSVSATGPVLGFGCDTFTQHNFTEPPLWVHVEQE